jgi:flagellar hook-associated protein 3 FlgL
MLRVSTEYVTRTAINDLRRLSDEQARLHQNIATGRRLVKPSDDPAATGRVLNRQIELDRVGNYQTVASQAKSRAEASLTALTQLQKIASRLSEVTSLAAGADPQSMAAYGAEVAQLLEQATNVANSRFGADYLFAGTAVDTRPFSPTRDAAGVLTAVAYAGNGQDATIGMGDGRALAPNPGAATTNPAIADFLNNLVDLRNAMATGDAATLVAMNATMDAHEDTLIGAIGTVGAVQTRIDSNQAQLTGRAADLQRLIAGDTDADIATSMVRLTETQTAYQAALNSTANLFKVSLLDYLK